MEALSEDEITVGEVSCFLLPINNGQLLLPTFSVAEIITLDPNQPDQQPKPRLGQEMPEWFVGDLPWRGLIIPMLSFEVITGRKSATSENSKVAVLNKVDSDLPLSFFAISITGIPHRSRINPEGIAELNDIDPKPYEVMHVGVGDEKAIIPDVSALQNACMRLTIL